MSPEELNRTMDFIIQSQARLAIAQEQDRERSVEIRALTVKVVRLTEPQSERMDRQDAFQRETMNEIASLRKEAKDFQQEALKLLHRALHMLNLILDKLPSGRPS
jgi:hypothetical protein